MLPPLRGYSLGFIKSFWRTVDFTLMSIQKPTRLLKRKRLLTTLVVAGVVLTFVARWFLISDEADITIGVEGRRSVTLPDEQLEAVPYTHGDALAVRIVSVAPVEQGFRYDIRYMAYGPGEHNLCEYLVSQRGMPLTSRSGMTVVVEALLAEEESGVLFETAATPIDLQSRYRVAMTLLWGLWAMLLIPLALYGRKARGKVVKESPPPSVPDRLRQLLETAEHQALCVEQQADLETLLLLFWAERLQVSSRRLVDTLSQLRKHPAASAQLSAVETWLHGRPASEHGSVAAGLLVELGWHRDDSDEGVAQQ
jgi:hypothetical protein